jgi:transforming growth factor-beta-induced protein
VLVPELADVVDLAVKAGNFQTLATAIETAGLLEALKGAGPFTVFAPTDEAFAALPKGTVETLLMPENKEKLVAILKYHVVSGRQYANQVVGLKTLTTLQGGTLKVMVSEEGATIGGAKLLKTDLQARNGVIHVIDRVLLPQ